MSPWTVDDRTISPNARDRLLELFDGDCMIYAVKMQVARLPWFEEYVKEKLLGMGGGVWTLYLGDPAKAEWHFVYVRQLEWMPEKNLEDEGYQCLFTFMFEKDANGRMRQKNPRRSREVH